jgi:hypothetical protein
LRREPVLLPCWEPIVRHLAGQMGGPGWRCAVLWGWSVDALQLFWHLPGAVVGAIEPPLRRP